MSSSSSSAAPIKGVTTVELVIGLFVIVCLMWHEFDKFHHLGGLGPTQGVHCAYLVAGLQ